MKRKILIVDDYEMNRQILSDMLIDEYDIIATDTGIEALKIMEKFYNTISVVLLDIAMPGMDGFAVMEKICEDRRLSQIPIIAMTENTDEESEIHALSLGAIDFATKPFREEIIRQRIKNVIHMREDAACVSSMRRDELTGLYNRKTFFAETERMVQEHEAGYYVMSCFDIDNFKAINDQYGTKIGDELLCLFATTIQEMVDNEGGICARFDADDFAMLYPISLLENGQIKQLHDNVKEFGIRHTDCNVSIGRYVVADLSIPASAMYDRALLSMYSIKSNFDNKIAMYDESMRVKMLEEREIISEMQNAIDTNQFKVWLQPQYNHATGAIIGAEALVRWHHPEKKLIPPDRFISIFERNGFIYELDKYVWEQCCILLRKWIDEGKTTLPISVNVSRYDALRGDFFDVVTNLVEKYSIPVELFRMEITESAFSEATDHIINVVKRLIAYGFTLEIDDFGSGYSSLNTLKDVPAQVLKLDMHFFSKTDNIHRSGNIIESIVRMAKWLGMAVIAEGVENKEQADYLKTIGCYYIQGYYYAKPMLIDEYEALINESSKEPELSLLQTVNELDNNAFWDPKSLETLIFNSYVGGACIFEYHDENLELLRVNEQFKQGVERFLSKGENVIDWDPIQYLDDDNKKELFSAIKRAINIKKETSCNLMISREINNIVHTEYYRVTFRVIASSNTHKMFYCGIANLTEIYEAQKERYIAEKKWLEAAQRLEIIMNNLNGGVSAIQIFDDKTSNFVFNNEKYFELFGYTREQAIAEKLDIMTLILPEDFPEVMRKINKLKKDKIPTVINYRCKKRDGGLTYIRINASLMEMEGYGDVITSVLMDVSEKRELEDQLNAVLENINGGVSAIFEQNGKNEVKIINQQYYNLIGYSKEQFDNEVKNILDLIHPDDHDRIEKEFKDAFYNKEKYTMEYRIIRRDGEIRHVLCNTNVVYIFGINSPVQLAVSNDITDLRVTEQRASEVYNETRRILENIGEKIGEEIIKKAIPSGFISCVCAEHGKYMLYCNDEFRRIFSYSTYEKIEPIQVITKLSDYDDRHELVKKTNRLLTDGTPFQCTYRIKNGANSCRWVSHRAAVAQQLPDGVIVNVFIMDITEQMEERERLRISEELNRLAVAHSGNIITRYDVKNRTLTLPENVNSELELESVQCNLPDEQIESGRISTDTADAFRRIFEGISNGENYGAVKFKLRMKKDWRWLEAQYTTVFSRDGKATSGVISFSDITENLEKEIVYNKWQQSLEERSEDSFTLFRCNLSNTSSLGTWAGKLLHMNYDYTQNTFDERNSDYARRYVYIEDQSAYCAFLYSDTLLAEYYRKQRSKMLEYREINLEGNIRWLRLTVDLVEYPSSKDIEVYLMYEDIDEKRKAELYALEASQKDPLTGVWNRTSFVAKTDLILETSKKDELHALIMLDIDNFKHINDTYGHAVGDKVLKSLSEKVSSILRGYDLVGRLGGDEFIVFIKSIPGAEIASAKANKICEILSDVECCEVPVTVSMGIAIAPEHGRTFDELYKEADNALYEQKKNGKNGFRFVNG